MVHGYTEMMISEYCAIASFVGTGKKENCPMPCVTEDYALKDRKGEVFPLRTDPYCRMHIMNSHEMDLRAMCQSYIEKDYIFCASMDVIWIQRDCALL